MTNLAALIKPRLLSTLSPLAMSIPKLQKAAIVAQVSQSPDAIEYADIESPQISGPHDVIIKNRYAGVNFIETYFRQGIYPATFPYIFGREAAGEVAAVGDAVKNYKVGDKVAYLSPATLAQYTKIEDSRVQVKKLAPDTTDHDLEKWAAILLQGLTVLTLTTEAYHVQPRDFVLVWAAAGGVGQILTKYLSSIGARVIAVASSDEKLAIAKKLGAEYLVKQKDDVPAKVAEITGGKGVAASFDGVGKDTFEASLASLARKGTLVSFGNASGPVPPFTIGRLSAKNNRILRPQLYGYIEEQQEWDFYTDLLEKSLAKKAIDITIYKTYPLSEYKQAAKDLEGRISTGKLVVEIP